MLVAKHRKGVSLLRSRVRKGIGNCGYFCESLHLKKPFDHRGRRGSQRKLSKLIV